MSGYNSFIGKIVSNLENDNMQSHLRDVTEEQSDERRIALEGIIRREYSNFTWLLYQTAIGKHEDGKYLKECVQEYEDDLVDIFAKMNEDCLIDPYFSECLAGGKLYTKNIGTEKDHLIVYPPNNGGFSISHNTIMDILFIPSPTPEQLNKVRLDFKEYFSNGIYPYISLSVDIDENGNIIYNQAMNVDGESKTPVDISESNFKFGEGINHVRDVIVDLFEKSGIKEKSNTNQK